MDRSFVHLHLHTQYSLLDSAIRIEALVPHVVQQGFSAVAMTDHANLFGAIEFYTRCKKAGIKPIIGIELNIIDGELGERRSQRAYHLTVLARNHEGYRNLMALISRGYLDGYEAATNTAYVNGALLDAYRGGLIALSGDLGGQIPQAILRNEEDEAHRLAGELGEIYGQDGFYLEVMANQLTEQKRVNAALKRMSQVTGIPLVATNDCHYLTQKEAQAHGILMCIQLQKSVAADSVMAHGIEDFYVKSAEEMWSFFADVPEACANTVKIADSVEVEIPLGHNYLPQFKVPEAYIAAHDLRSADAQMDHYFAELARQGLRERLAHFARLGREVDEGPYWERLEVEIGVIQQMTFSGYFLIVWDFINWAKEHGIPVGPGRGSGAGSLVAYSLRITDVDPLQYALLFERFLNPERVSMPDFDIDFCMNRRGEVISYVTQKYGVNNVGQIATFGSLKARACLKDVGRALNFTYAETDRLAKAVPEQLNITLAQALAQEPKLRAAVESDPRIRQLYDIALQLEGLYRQAGMHAAGIVISEEVLWHYVPVFRGANGEIVTQYAKNEVEEAGLVKFDFLGLKTLTVIAEAVRMINAQRQASGQEAFELDAIPMDDREVFRLISEGRTTGVFQLESSGFRELLTKLRPDCFEDIVAAVALYRPGPLGSGMVDQFIACKHGQREVVYPHPWLEEILRETYGVIVYQEQVMQAAQKIGGYTLGGADIMRRAMGKKKAEEMAKQRQVFVDGARRLQVDPQLAGEIFDNIEKFAGYGFNKSHSAAYALISYQTAYLKAHFPVEFTAATLTCDRENTDKVVRTIYDARANGIAVLPPDVNASQRDFSVHHGKVRFGLGAVKGIGEGAIESILEARVSEPFEGLFDFCRRVDLRRVNRRVLEALVKCGAFDTTWPEALQGVRAIGEARARMFAAISSAIERGQKAQSERDGGQTSLFDIFAAADDDDALGGESYPQADAWDDRMVLSLEKDALGFFVSGHPLDRYATEISIYTQVNSTHVGGLSHGTELSLVGVVAALREKAVKRGDGRMAFLTLDDKVGQVEVICFPRVFAECEDAIRSDLPLLVSGRVSVEGDEGAPVTRIRAESVKVLADARQQRVGHVLFQIAADTAGPDVVAHLATLIDGHPGPCSTFLRITWAGLGSATLPLGAQAQVAVSDELIQLANQVLGEGSVKLAVRA